MSLLPETWSPPVIEPLLDDALVVEVLVEELVVAMPELVAPPEPEVVDMVPVEPDEDVGPADAPPAPAPPVPVEPECDDCPASQLAASAPKSAAAIPMLRRSAT
jgi:hypothetical protein